jgi:hypothetical protein
MPVLIILKELEMSKKLPIIILALTAIPMSVLFGLAMRSAECETILVVCVPILQGFLQIMISAILAEKIDE